MFKEGEEHFIWAFNYGEEKEALMIAELHSCDKCKKPTTVNGVWVMNEAPVSAIEEANSFKEKYGEISESCMNEDCDCFCEKCYHD